jgi:hypothetical protein
LKVAGTGALLLGAAGLVIEGYVFVTSFSDLRRYIKISTM